MPIHDTFRRVQLPQDVTGSLYLHNMPGRPGHSGLEQDLAQVKTLAIDLVLCLAGRREIEQKSPAYAELLDSAEGMPCDWQSFPIPDLGVPESPDDFWQCAADTADLLRHGNRILIHCSAGIGRTGLMAAAVLQRLGLSPDDALNQVRRTGSGPETTPQQNLLRGA